MDPNINMEGRQTSIPTWKYLMLIRVWDSIRFLHWAEMLDVSKVFRGAAYEKFLLSHSLGLDTRGMIGGKGLVESCP
jgi:hypothetical protein